MFPAMQHVRWLAGAAAIAFGLAAEPATADTVTTTFQVSATVDPVCQIVANSLPFGTYTGRQTDADTTLTITCTNTTPYSVGLDAGTAPGGTTATREMTGTAGALLPYGLYQDAARATNWGNLPGTDTVAGTGNGSAQTLTVYGRLAAGQYVTPGSYSDTITATVTY